MKKLFNIIVWGLIVLWIYNECENEKKHSDSQSKEIITNNTSNSKITSNREKTSPSKIQHFSNNLEQKTETKNSYNSQESKLDYNRTYYYDDDSDYYSDNNDSDYYYDDEEEYDYDNEDDDNQNKIIQNYYSKYYPTETRVRVGAVCNDGTTTKATGRGACSHHGGVAYWLYE